VTGLFAFAYRPPKEEKYPVRRARLHFVSPTDLTVFPVLCRPHVRKRYDADKGWGVYDVAKEYERIGIPSKYPPSPPLC
jgi:hypothetical protein